MSKLSLVFLSLLLGGAACEAATAPGDHDNLIAARARWDAMSGPTYSSQVDRACECVLGGRAMTVTVSRGSVTAASYEDSGSAVDQALLAFVPTVPDLFDLIQDALDRKAAYLAVTYDPTYGYPTHIQIDYSVNAVDDEVRMNVRDLNFFAAE